MILIEELSIIAKIGSGEYGQVFKAIYKQNDGVNAKMVALKEIKINDTCNKNDLIREANILSSCDHENIVKLHAVCYENSILKYLIMEYMNFGDLHSYLNRLRSSKVNFIRLYYAYYD